MLATKSDLSSLDIVLNHFMMKLFKTANIAIVDRCRSNFGLDLPSVLSSKRVRELDVKFDTADNYLYKSYVYISDIVVEFPDYSVKSLVSLFWMFSSVYGLLDRLLFIFVGYQKW